MVRACALGRARGETSGGRREGSLGQEGVSRGSAWEHTRDTWHAVCVLGPAM
jgi:hypothetical protein